MAMPEKNYQAKETRESISDKDVFEVKDLKVKIEQLELQLKKKQSLSQQEGDLEKRKKIEIIERSSFNSYAKMELLLTFLGEKSSFLLGLENWLPENLPLKQRKVADDELLKNIEKIFKDLKFFYKIRKKESGEVSHILVSKIEENLIKLNEAIKEEDSEKIGRALGYPESAIKAYINRFKEKEDIKTIKSLIEETIDSISGKEGEQLVKEDSYRFLSFAPSPEGWEEEIKLAQKYQEIVKKESPAIYMEIMNK